MIITERLEELIKQQAMIYDTKTTMIMLDRHSRVYQDCLILGHPINGKCTFHLRDLFETEEQAEWARKTIIEYTERFEPPMWEDIENEYLFNFVVNNEFIHFFVNKERELISVMNETHFNIIFTKFNVPEEILKENYKKACEIVRELFIKEEK